MYKPNKSGCYIYTNPTWPIYNKTKNSTSLTVVKKGGSKKTVKKKYKYLKKRKGTRKRLQKKGTRKL